MIHYPKDNEWEADAFKFRTNGGTICAVAKAYDDRHEISLSVEHRKISGMDALFVAQKFLDSMNLFHIGYGKVSGTQIIRYYPGMIAN